MAPTGWPANTIYQMIARKILSVSQLICLNSKARTCQHNEAKFSTHKEMTAPNRASWVPVPWSCLCVAQRFCKQNTISLCIPFFTLPFRFFVDHFLSLLICFLSYIPRNRLDTHKRIEREQDTHSDSRPEIEF